VKLYVLITESACKRPWFETAQLAIEGGADCLQLREKNLEGAEFLKRARMLTDLCGQHNVLCIINDRPDIALLSNADGVHVGQDDLPAPEVRKIIGANKVLGVSTHNLAQAQQAILDGADYIGVGPFFKSPTKPRDFTAGPDYARQVAQHINLSAVAIGGIIHDNVNEVPATGLKAIAVTAAVTQADDPRAAAAALKQRLLPPVGQAFLPVSSTPSQPVGQAFLPVSSSQIHTFNPESDITIHRRHLPHWQMKGATYLLTFRIASGEFSMSERLLILNHIKSGHGRFYELLASIVMPDHGHVLLTPCGGFDLARINKGIKGVTARLINQARGTQGCIWQDETFDRIMRDQAELDEKLNYVVNNAAKAGLVEDPWDYQALYVAQ
jgi:thiamine-phosphate diphosphorylase